LLKKGYDAHNGVRPMRRLLQDTLEDHVASQLLDDSLEKGHIIQVSAANDELTYKAASEAVPAR